MAAGAATPKAPAAPNTVTVTSPGDQDTNPLSTAIDLAITATDSDPTQTLTFTAAGLPTGLAISAAGAITGTITAPGTYDVTVTATDTTMAAGSASFTWTAANTVTVTSPGDQATSPLSTAIDLPITATDSDPTQTLTFTAAGLPAGLGISAAGVITGTITATGTYDVTVTATDTVGETATAAFTWTAGNSVLVAAPAKEQSWAGLAVSVKITATDPDPDATLLYSAAGLPTGLTINATTGVISGIPTKISVGTVEVTATDSVGSAGSAAIRWSVGFAVTMPNPGRVTGIAGQALDVPLSYTDALGKKDHVTFSATGLPSGLAFVQDPTRVYGWPATAGSYSVTIHAKGSLGDADSMTFPLTVRPAPDSGPAGQVRLALGGLCLNDTGNKTANGTRVVLWNCQSGSAQNWTIASDATIRIHGRCLDIAGAPGAGSAGQQVLLEPCSGTTREMWEQGTAGELVNPPSGLCLTDPGAKTANGTAPAMAACRRVPSATWTLPAQPILSAMEGKCVDDYHSVGTNGNKVDTYSCNGTPVQSWTFEPDGTLRIYGNKCLTVTKPGVLGAKIDLWTCDGAASQKWAVAQSRSLGSELTQDGVCLAIPSMTAIDGSQLITASCTATDPRVHWHIW